jgi:hypothetical protein
VFALLTTVAEFRYRGIRVDEQALFVRPIGPRARDNASAVARTDPVFIAIDQRVERRALDQTLFDQERFQGFDAKGHVGGNGLVLMFVLVIV